MSAEPGSSARHRGLFITFEGTEGGGKSTQIILLARRLESEGWKVRTLREPGGTPIGEEIRHTLKHSAANHGMTPATELLLMNASRAQLVREVIEPALHEGEIILCDRFHDSTVAYQGYGRGLPRAEVDSVIRFAVGNTLPDLTLLLWVPVAVSESRRRQRSGAAAADAVRDRFEEADRAFFERVELGYREIASAEPGRIRMIDAAQGIPEVHEAVYAEVRRALVAHRLAGRR